MDLCDFILLRIHNNRRTGMKQKLKVEYLDLNEATKAEL